MKETLLRISKNIHILNTLREPKTDDIFRRLLAISPERIVLKNLLNKRPVAAFNPAMMIKDKYIDIYARVIAGYYTYTSVVAKFEIEIDKIFNNIDEIPAKVIIFPENNVDLWGIEDPRVTVVKNRILITYAGRTKWFFNENKMNRTIPVVYEDGVGKLFYMMPPSPLKEIISLNKDSFIQLLNKRLYVFHRPIIKKAPPSLWYGSLDSIDSNSFQEKIIKENTILMVPSSYELNIGWGAPLIKIDDKYIAIVHARSIDESYRLYAIQLEVMDDEIEITGVSQKYIMEPKKNYEKYGDRPNVVFVCGAVVFGNKVIISYGAADTFIGFAETDVSELVSSIKKLI